MVRGPSSRPSSRAVGLGADIQHLDDVLDTVQRDADDRVVYRGVRYEVDLEPDGLRGARAAGANGGRVEPNRGDLDLEGAEPVQSPEPASPPLTPLFGGLSRLPIAPR